MTILKKKILLVHDYTALGGVVQLNLDLARFLNQNGFQPVILIPNLLESRKKKMDTFTQSINLKDSMETLEKIVKESDHVLVSLSYRLRSLAQESMRQARLGNKPYIVWLHTKLPQGYRETLQGEEMEKILKDPLCRSFVCVSQNVAEDIIGTFGSSPKIKVVYPGVYMPQRFESELIQPSLDLENTILFAGRLSNEKGADIFIRAFAVLLKSFPTLKAVIIGDGEERESLVDLISRLRINESVTLLPSCSREKLFQYIQSCRVFCVSSRTESFCITLAEALALGATVVGPDMGGPAEILRGGKFGYLFKPEDWRDLARVLKKALHEGTSTKLEQKLYAIKSFSLNDQFIRLAKLMLAR